MTLRSKPPRDVVAITLFVIAMSPLLAACGGGSNDAASGDSASEQAGLKFARCMREHGVNVPDPGTRGEINIRVTPGTKAKTDAAQRACSHYLRGLARNASPAQMQRAQDAALAYARCMRSHGVDFPDPKVSADGGMVQFGGPGLNPNSSKFQQADKACRKLLPGKPVGRAGKAPTQSSDGSGGVMEAGK